MPWGANRMLRFLEVLRALPVCVHRPGVIPCRRRMAKPSRARGRPEAGEPEASRESGPAARPVLLSGTLSMSATSLAFAPASPTQGLAMDGTFVVLPTEETTEQD